MSTSANARTVGDFTLDDCYLCEEGTIYITGIQALVRVLLDRMRLDRRADLDTAAFVTGYEGSPLARFDLELARQAKLLNCHHVVHSPGLNEELAATAVLGSQLATGIASSRFDGVLGLWYGKSPGLDRAGDALRHANMAGTHPRGGALLVVGDDPGAKSSSLPSASEHALADLGMPIFYPADAQDVLDYGQHAIELSRASGVWAAMKIVTDVADCANTALVRPNWTPPTLSGLAYVHRPDAHLLGANLAALERGFNDVRWPIAVDYIRASGVNQIVAAGPRDRIGIVAAGKTYLDLRQALHTLELDELALARLGIRILKLGAIHPVEATIVRTFADGLTEILVVEEKRSFIETAVKEILYGEVGTAVYGKRAPDGTTLFEQSGELNPDLIATRLARQLNTYGVSTPRKQGRLNGARLPLLSRTPYFCSGCPHNSSTKVTEGALVGAGIGCHAMAVFMAPGQVGNVIGLTQMGGEGAQWMGMAPFVGAENFVQNMGDGTFAHSGSLAVRAAVAAGVDITFKLLYNSVVAMTGGQHPTGALPVDRLAHLLLLEGVTRVIITSEDPARLRGLRLPKGVEVRHRDTLPDSQRQLAATPGVKVLIHDQECTAEKRRKRRRGQQPVPQRKVVINERLCEGCGDCGKKSNCLSVQPITTEFGRKTTIHQSSCNVDYSCLAGDCPSFLTVIPTGHRPPRPIAALAAELLPDPARRSASPDVSVRIVGIGGTGVITTAQILATAAVLDGKYVRGLDQSGLAQKGGAVISDIKITSTTKEQAPKLATAECDLYLACDSLVATDPAHLAATDPGRTVTVVSTSEIPTGRMIVDTSVSFPDRGAVRSAIDQATVAAHYLDAGQLAEALFDDDQYANILQLGAAYQLGTLPLSATAIERAIALNGTAIGNNLQAFRRGRQAIADPAALHATCQPPPRSHVKATSPSTEKIRALVKAPPRSELARLIDIRIPDLVDYQNQRYARAFAAFVEQVRELEAVRWTGSTTISEAVAVNLYKLMAYKDEYEVARLSLDPDLGEDIQTRFGVGTHYYHHIHPPVLRALGMRHKITLGSWSRPVFGLLRAMRKTRGTALDPFGHNNIRKTERALIDEYRDIVLQAITHAETHHYAVILELAALPDMVRGYEDIKSATVANYHETQNKLLEQLGLASKENRRPAAAARSRKAIANNTPVAQRDHLRDDQPCCVAQIADDPTAPGS